LASVESRLSRRALDVYSRALRATLDAVGEAVVLADERGRVLLANEPFAELADLGPGYRLEVRNVRAALTALGAAMDEAEINELLTGTDGAARTLELGDERAVLCEVSSVALDGENVGRLLRLRDITWERRQVRDLEHRALHDDLTGLPGRELLVDRLERALTRQDREGGAVGVAFVDLDTFKEVNDRHGHAAGDRVLIEVSGRLTSELRDADTVGRLGGDEFLIICDGLEDESALVMICERIQERIAQPYRLGSLEVTLSASLGAVLEWDAHVSPAKLIERADALMYAAKRRSSRHEIFADGRPRTATSWGAAARSPMASQHIREALDADQLFLVFLPVVALDDGRTIAVEGLLRCAHPELQTATPRELLELIEQARMIKRFDEWILQQAASAARALLDAAAANRVLQRHAPVHEPVRVELNLSAAQLAHDEIAIGAAKAASEHQIDAGLLSFDIADALVGQDAPWLAPTLAALRELGCHVVVDDVMAPDLEAEHLRERGFDGIKLDRPVIGHAVDDPEFAARAKVAVASARARGLTVTAEGVDDQRRLQAARDLGCDSAQGFGFQGFPRTVGELVKVIDGSGPE
jgi:diguanylate cyclase (GGDEF)-like protein